MTTLLHSSYKKLSTILSRGECSTALSIIPRLRVCWRPLRTREVNIGWNFVHIWKSYIVPTSWICEKQTAVSLSSTESEIISLDAGLRMCGQNTLTARFHARMHTFFLVHTSHCGSRCRATCLHETCPATCHQLPRDRARRAINPMRTRNMKSIAPWRCTTLSQVMSPTSSTTSSTTLTTQRLLPWSSRMNPLTWTLNCRTRAMRNSTMSLF